MKINKYIGFIFFSLLFVGLTSCSDEGDEITSYELDRVLAPFKIEYVLNDVVNLTLKWKDLESADSYIVELYTDSLEFLEENFVAMDEVLTNQFEYTLKGTTQYSARIKAVSTTNNDSKWNGIAFKTSFKSVFLDFKKGDITETSLRFRFPPGTDATSIVLKSGKDEIRREVTAEEITNGAILFTDLKSNVTYFATLFDGDKKIGEISETTIMEGTIKVKPSDDLKALLEAANEGDAFLLDEGVYLDGEVVTISTSVTIMGKRAAEPTIQAQFELDNEAGANTPTVVFKLLKLDGKAMTTDNAVRIISKTGNFGDIVLESVEVKDYNKALIGVNDLVGKINSIKIEDCIISNIMTNGSEAIDVRKAYVEKLTINNSTFANVAPARSFIRMDDSSGSFESGLNSTVEVTNNTFYKVNDKHDSKGFFYVRFKTNSNTFKNNLMVESNGIFSKESKTSEIVCGDNNYFNAPNYMAGGAVPEAKIDSASPKTENPEFEDVENGNFKVGNGMVKSGDPRWLN